MATPWVPDREDSQARLCPRTQAGQVRMLALSPVRDVPRRDGITTTMTGLAYRLCGQMDRHGPTSALDAERRRSSTTPTIRRREADLPHEVRTSEAQAQACGVSASDMPHGSPG
jgi:hypothetical protein